MSFSIGYCKGFFKRQFKSDSNVFINCSQEEFHERLLKDYNENPVLLDGYAPFCKVFIRENDVDMKYGLLEITDENKTALVSSYVFRPNSISVLQRSFAMSIMNKIGIERPVAKYLYCEMYTGEQMKKEDVSEGIMDTEYPLDYYVFNVKPIMTKDEKIPNVPITHLINAIGPSVGGSGYPLDKDAYQHSVEFFSKYAFIDMNL